MTRDAAEKTVEQTETGYRLKIKSKRGTATRDQDTVTVEAREETLADIDDVRLDLLALARETMDAQRRHQPDSDSEDDGDREAMTDGGRTVQEELEKALDAAETPSARYHIREAWQLLQAERELEADR